MPLQADGSPRTMDVIRANDFSLTLPALQWRFMLTKPP